MKIPESIRISGVEFSVVVEPNVRIGDQLCYGSISYDESIIRLSENDGAEHQRRCITLLHEILHGIQESNGLTVENEEAVIEMFARGLYQVLEDNIERLYGDSQKE